MKQLLFICSMFATFYLIFSIPTKRFQTYQSLPGQEGTTTASFMVPNTNQIGNIQSDLLVVKNWGIQKNGSLKSDINIIDAWKISKCLDENQKDFKPTIVAIIDTGIDYNHPYLNKFLWTEATTKTNNSDDITIGWNFVEDNNKPFDKHGHGSHIAGIISTLSGNNKTVNGKTCLNTKLMALKYYDTGSGGKNNLLNTIKAIHYAIDHGADIINYSGGGSDFSRDEFEAIKRAQSKGILFIAAAGNHGQNTKSVPYYPGSYSLDNIVSVAALDNHNQLISSSNYGSTTVSIAAPGDSIYSSLPDNQFGYMTGTSQATAFVTGVAALLKTTNPIHTYKQVKEALLQGSDKLAGLSDFIQSSGKLNAMSALKYKSTPSVVIAKAEDVKVKTKNIFEVEKELNTFQFSKILPNVITELNIILGKLEGQI